LPRRGLGGLVEVFPNASDHACGDDFALKIDSKLHNRRTTRQRVFQVLDVGLNVASQRRRLIRAAHSAEIA
jgi:hypothetical protein